jgi:hypothetical protein
MFTIFGAYRLSVLRMWSLPGESISSFDIEAGFAAFSMSLLIFAIYTVNLVVFFKVQQIASKANV